MRKGCVDMLYETPGLRITRFDAESVMTASGGDDLTSNKEGYTLLEDGAANTKAVSTDALLGANWK